MGLLADAMGEYSRGACGVVADLLAQCLFRHVQRTSVRRFVLAVSTNAAQRRVVRVGYKDADEATVLRMSCGLVPVHAPYDDACAMLNLYWTGYNSTCSPLGTYLDPRAPPFSNPVDLQGQSLRADPCARPRQQQQYAKRR